MRAQKTQNTATFEVPRYAVVGRRYECVWKSMLKRAVLSYNQRYDFRIRELTGILIIVGLPTLLRKDWRSWLGELINLKALKRLHRFWSFLYA